MKHRWKALVLAGILLLLTSETLSEIYAVKF